jgi:hypothetical protein
MKNRFTAVALTLTCICSTAMAQWEWLDRDGRKVFSDLAPSPDVLEKDIVKRPVSITKAATPTARGAAVAEANAPAIAPALVPTIARNASTPGGLDKELEAKKKQAADAEAAKRKAEEDRVAKAKAENCTRAKQAKSSFDSGIRISRTNAAGEREILDDASRAVELKHVQGMIDSECK